jgi:hypothetical protein
LLTSSFCATVDEYQFAARTEGVSSYMNIVEPVVATPHSTPLSMGLMMLEPPP